MHVSFKSSAEYFSGSCVAIPFQNILNLIFSQRYEVHRSCQGPEGTNSLNGPDQPPLGTPTACTHLSPMGPGDPFQLSLRPFLHAWLCCRSACLQLCLAHACVQPWTPLIQTRICGLISCPDCGPASPLWPAQQSLGCVRPWLPAPGLILICWLVLLAKPQPCLSPWSFLMIWTFCWSWLPFLALPCLPCSGAVGLVRPMPWHLHYCTWLPTPCTATGHAAPCQFILARQLFHLHAEFIPGSPGNFKCTF